MAQITTNFTTAEFERTRTGLPNSIPMQLMASVAKGCTAILQPLRNYLGVPVTISSGYRSPQVNAAVGGVRSSQHMFGQAADIVVPEHLYDRAWEFLTRCPDVDQLLGGSSFIHVSWVAPSSGARPRQQFIRHYYDRKRN